MITQFQLDQKIISSSNDDGAGNYGPKTRAALAIIYADYTTKRQKELKAIEEARKLLLSDHDAWQLKYQQAEKQVAAFGQPRIRDAGDHVRALQEFLSHSGSTVTVNGTMTLQTVSAIRKYQKSRGLKQTGMIDETTQLAMVDDMASTK